MRFLFTSASKPAAIETARILAGEGHVVYAADEERTWGTSPARYSRSYAKFYPLDAALDLTALWKIVQDQVDTVIPFGCIPTLARERIEEAGANVLGEMLFQDDLEFSDFVRDHVLGWTDTRPSVVKVPASFTIHTRAEIAEILGQYPTTTFSLHPEQYFDSDDEDTLVELESPDKLRSSMVFDAEEQQLLVSCRTLSDSMVETIEKLPISKERAFRMLEIVDGGTEYSAHAFVNTGTVRAFVVTAERGRSRDVVAIPCSQPLFEIFYQFTERFVAALPRGRHNRLPDLTPSLNYETFSGHLSLRFCVRDEIRNGDFIRKVTATSCTHKPHTSLALLYSTPSARRQLAEAYTDTNPLRGHKYPLEMPTIGTAWGFYSVPAAVKTFLHMIRTFAPRDRKWWARVSRVLIMCCVKLLCFQEEMWNMRDPGPALCLWAGLLAGNIGNWPWVRPIGTTLLRKGQLLLVRVCASRFGAIVRSFTAITLHICYFWIGVLLQMRSS